MANAILNFHFDYPHPSLNNDAQIQFHQSTVQPGHHEGLARDETATVVTLSSHHLIIKMMMTIYIVMKCMSVTTNEHFHFYSDKNAFMTLTSLVTWSPPKILELLIKCQNVNLLINAGSLLRRLWNETPSQKNLRHKLSHRERNKQNSKFWIFSVRHVIYRYLK